MKASKQISTITPTMAKDISFNDKVEAVDTALRTRASVRKEIKSKWVRVVQVLAKYDQKAPGRRPDAGSAANLVTEVVVYEAKPEIAPELQQLINAGSTYELTRVAENPTTMRLIENKAKGFKQLMEDFIEARAIAGQSLVRDDAKTKDARAELQAAVDEYLEALESYDDTVTSVANVKEYIGIVKDIADISAIAQGVKARE